MFLAFDIGNTNIKTGLFHDDALIELKFSQDPSEIKAYLKLKTIEQAAVSSVVPALTEKISKVLSAGGISPLIIDKDSKFNLKIKYDSFETLGIDRICSAEGAFALFRNSEGFNNYNVNTYILSVDFGTATTINIVSYPGEFIGGIISPGIGLMFDSLNTKTAQLPDVPVSSYKNLIGSDTNSSIASGVINSHLGLIERTINYLKLKMNAEEIKIFVTGGNAEKLLPYLTFEHNYERGLVLIGIKSVYEKNL